VIRRTANPSRIAAAQNGSSDQSIGPARSKKRAILRGETRIGRQGKKKRSAEKGKNSITPEPPSVSISRRG
jgi:hypothetical protein